jgi:hypothetical protein
MNALIRAAEWSLGRLLAVCTGLRSYRGTAEDQHALMHLAICQSAAEMRDCPGMDGNSCRADRLLCELERRARVEKEDRDIPIARGST